MTGSGRLSRVIISIASLAVPVIMMVHLTGCHDQVHPDHEITKNITGEYPGISIKEINLNNADSLFDRGVELYRLNNYKQALACFISSLEIAEKFSDTLLKAKCLERLGSLQLTLGDDHQALKLYYESLPFFEQTGNKEGIAKVYNIIGLYKSGQEEYDSAEVYYLKAIRLNEEINNQTGIVHNKGNLGYLYEHLGRYNEAENIYNGLVEFLIKTGDSINLPDIYYNFSSLYQKQDKPDTAMLYLLQAVAISEKTRDSALMSELFTDMGDLFFSNKKFDSAAFYLEKSVVCAKADNNMSIQLQAEKLLMKLYLFKDNYKNAAAKFQRILVLTDSVYKRKIRNNLKSSELQYENQKKNHLIEMQNIQLQSFMKQKQFYQVLFIISIISAALFIALIILIIKNGRKKRKLLDEQLKVTDLKIENAIKTDEINKIKIESIEEDLKINKREQISHSLALEQKNEILGLIYGKITEAMQNSGSISIAELNGLVSTIKMQIRDSSDSDLFNQKFNQLHQDFYTNLKQAHPGLTKAELKFCAYLKLNLSGSQIASILNVTTEAIRKTRYRLRKKLNLSPDKSLEAYISKF